MAVHSVADRTADAAAFSPAGAAGRLSQLVKVDLSILYLVLGLLGVLPLALLTPPFQVADEQQHFYRAYEISEFGMHGVVHDGAAGAFLPSSLPALAERFLGSRAIHADRPLHRLALAETLPALAVPLDPALREFVDFTGAAFYAPLPYLPQAAAILIGRQIGLGPLGLLYAARLANGLASLLIVVAALRLMPVGRMMLLVLALLPMVLFEFASASPDAAVIATALLFTAIAMRARFSASWSGGQILVACLTGAVFCTVKPVYAPLLVIALPGGLRRETWRATLRAHAIILTTVLGATAIWLHYSASSLVLPREGTNLPLQLSGILADPAHFAGVVLATARGDGIGWIFQMIGWLGWLTVMLPPQMYLWPIFALAACFLLPRAQSTQVGLPETAWLVAMLGASSVLVILALYLYWSPVDANVVDGVQGRYFLPLAGLAVMTLNSVLRPTRRGVPLLAPVVMLLVALEVLMTPAVIANAYQVFD